MLGDLKYALSSLVKAPVFACIAVLTVGLGIGANVAIFSVVEGALLRPLPFRHADRLVRIFEALDENGTRAASLNMSEPAVAHLAEFGKDTFEAVGAGAGGVAVIGSIDGSAAQTVPAAQITANFFDVLEI